MASRKKKIVKDPLYFYEDVVSKSCRKGSDDGGASVLGLVVDNGQPGDSSDGEDSIDGLKINRVKRGSARVSWHPRGDEEDVKERKLRLIDRSLMPGDVVFRNKGSSSQRSQRGQIRKVDVWADVQVVGTNQVVANVPSQRVRPLDQFQENEFVVCGNWVGVVLKVSTTLHVGFNDGSEVIVSDKFGTDVVDILDCRDERNYYGQYSYHPGMILKINLSYLRRPDTHFVRQSEELKQLLQESEQDLTKSVRVYVMDVEVSSVNISWQSNLSFKLEAVLSPPCSVFIKEDLKSLKKLDNFHSCKLQIGDRGFLSVTDGVDSILKYQEWEAHIKEDPWKLSGRDPEGAGASECQQDQNTTSSSQGSSDSTNCDYERLRVEEPKPKGRRVRLKSTSSMDGATKSKCVKYSTGGLYGPATRTRKDSSSFSSAIYRGSSKMCNLPRRDKDCIFNHLFSEDLRRPRGAVVEVLCTRSTATVVWQDGTVEEGVCSKVLVPDLFLDEYEYFCGDFVDRPKSSSSLVNGDTSNEVGVVQKVDRAARICTVQWLQIFHSEDQDEPLILEVSEECALDLMPHNVYRFRPGDILICRLDGNAKNNWQFSVDFAAGCQVVESLASGRILVRFADGSLSERWPMNLTPLVSDRNEWVNVHEWEAADASGWETDTSSVGNLMLDYDEDLQYESDYLETNSMGSLSLPSEEPIVEYFSKTVFNLKWCLRAARKSLIFLDGYFTTNSNESAFPSDDALVKEYLADARRNCLRLEKALLGPGRSYFDGYSEDEPENTNLPDGVVERRDKLRALLQECKMGKMVEKEISRLMEIVPRASPMSALETGLIVFSYWVSKAKKFALSLLKDDGVNHHFEVYPVVPELAGMVRTCPHVNPLMEEYSELKVSFFKLCLTVEPDSELLPRLVQSACEILNGFCYMSVRTASLSNQQSAPSVGGAGQVPANQAATAVEVAKSSVVPLAEPDPDDHDTADPPTSEVVEEVQSPEEEGSAGIFQTLESAPVGHHYFRTVVAATGNKKWITCLRKEITLLRTSLPPGIFVKGFEDRMDLLSVMMLGPERTPYQDGMFFFDFQLGLTYPNVPPSCHYYNYVSGRLNPNLYEEGKVCLSLLGTWNGKGNEMWNSSHSNMLQVLVSIQGLILVDEPYYNEAGYEKHKDTVTGFENSRLYNEMALLKVVQSMVAVAERPPVLFKDEVMAHLRLAGPRFIKRLEAWMEACSCKGSEPEAAKSVPGGAPDYPLFPISRGCVILVEKALNSLKATLAKMDEGFEAAVLS